MKDIVQEGMPVLREISKEVNPKDIATPYIQRILLDMREALASQHDGVAIAAPQIGVPLRIFVVSGKVFSEHMEEPTEPDKIFINPLIIKTSRKTSWLDEGCLSVRTKYGEVQRHDKATVEAYDETGRKFTLGGSGLLAQIFQHEIDHLNGVLFIDKARNLHTVDPETNNTHE